MSETAAAKTANAFEVLRRFVRRGDSAEVCELCSARLGPAHQHLFEPATRKLICACDPCAILFPGQAEKRFKRVPRRVRFLPDFRMTDAQWDSLMMPINMAFFFESTPQGRMVALYPSPAGATESLLTLDSWSEIVQENTALKEMEADVEALLVNRLGHSRGFTAAEYFIAPIDECFKLVGLIRAHWRGLSGGTEVWQQMARFFAELKEKSNA